MSKRAIIFVLLLTGCEQLNPPIPDQCMRREIFAQCMKLLPVGPTSTKYNDWAEVVSECASVATYQSYRRPEQVKPECHP